MRFKDEVFIVSGASSGIGLYCVELLLQAEARVVGFDMTESTLQHDRYRHVVVDVSNEDRVEKSVADVMEKHKKSVVL